MILNASAILSADDLPRELVEVPEWGGSVYVRTMTAGERDRFEAEHRRRGESGDAYEDIRARLAVSTVCDESGALLFTPADVPAISRKSAKALDRIFAAAQRLNGLSSQDVEDLRKNS